MIDTNLDAVGGEGGVCHLDVANLEQFDRGRVLHFAAVAQGSEAVRDPELRSLAVGALVGAYRDAVAYHLDQLCAETERSAA